MAVEEEISEELSQTFLSEMKIEEAIEETILESNGILEALQEAIGLHGIPPAQAEPETAVGLTLAQHEHVTAAEEQQAVNHIEPPDPPDPEWLTALYCKLLEDGSECQEPALPRPTPESLGHSQGSMTPEQQALHVARQSMRIPHTDAERDQFVRTLAVALGARRPEAGTIKALLAVLVTLERPDMGEEEAYTSTGASASNFKRWRKRVQSAQLGASLP